MGGLWFTITEIYNGYNKPKSMRGSYNNNFIDSFFVYSIAIVKLCIHFKWYVKKEYYKITKEFGIS